jgi:hypothetical protein
LTAGGSPFAAAVCLARTLHYAWAKEHKIEPCDSIRPENSPITRRRTVLEERVYARVAQRRGSISAEHGIGTLKKPYTALTPLML